MRDTFPPHHCSADGDTFTPTSPTLSPIYNSLGLIPPPSPSSGTRASATAPAERCVAPGCPLLLGPGADFHIEIEDPRMSDLAGGSPKDNDGRWKEIDMPRVVVGLIIVVLVLGCCVLALICMKSSV